MVIFSRFQLPVFDATEEGFRIQDSVVRILKKDRRQKPVVRFGSAHAKTQASETGSCTSANGAKYSSLGQRPRERDRKYFEG